VPCHNDGNNDEANLIARARNFDREAIAQLYRTYAESIYKYVYARVTHVQTAEDITSEVFLRALEGLDAFEYRGVPFSAWLYRIARDRVVDHYRKHTRQQATVALDEDIVAAGEAPDRAVLRGLDEENLTAAVESLTEDQRLVIIMRFLERQPIAEVARRLGKTETSIKALQRRALNALSRVLGGESP